VEFYVWPNFCLKRNNVRYTDSTTVCIYWCQAFTSSYADTYNNITGANRLSCKYEYSSPFGFDVTQVINWLPARTSYTISWKYPAGLILSPVISTGGTVPAVYIVPKRPDIFNMEDVINIKCDSTRDSALQWLKYVVSGPCFTKGIITVCSSSSNWSLTKD